MIKIYENKDEIIERLNKIFECFELGDAIQVNDEYIYIEPWVGSWEYKVRFYYRGKVFLTFEELERDILLHILNMVHRGIQVDSRVSMTKGEIYDNN